MKLESWFKENGLNLPQPSICKEFQFLHICWHNLWIALNHSVRPRLDTYHCFGYTTACRQCWCIPVSLCQMKVCHCRTVKINRFQYYTKENQSTNLFNIKITPALYKYCKYKTYSYKMRSPAPSACGC